jgi:hypothetical protein
VVGVVVLERGQQAGAEGPARLGRRGGEQQPYGAELGRVHHANATAEQRGDPPCLAGPRHGAAQPGRRPAGARAMRTTRPRLALAGGRPALRGPAGRTHPERQAWRNRRGARAQAGSGGGFASEFTRRRGPRLPWARPRRNPGLRAVGCAGPVPGGQFPGQVADLVQHGGPACRQGQRLAAVHASHGIRQHLLKEHPGHLRPCHRAQARAGPGQSAVPGRGSGRHGFRCRPGGGIGLRPGGQGDHGDRPARVQATAPEHGGCFAVLRPAAASGQVKQAPDRGIGCPADGPPGLFMAGPVRGGDGGQFRPDRAPVGVPAGRVAGQGQEPARQPVPRLAGDAEQGVGRAVRRHGGGQVSRAQPGGSQP